MRLSSNTGGGWNSNTADAEQITCGQSFKSTCSALKIVCYDVIERSICPSPTYPKMLQRSQDHWTLSLLVQSENRTFFVQNHDNLTNRHLIIAAVFVHSWFLVWSWQQELLLGSPMPNWSQASQRDPQSWTVASWAIETWSSQSLWAQKPHPFLFLRGNQSEDSWFKVKAITACLSGACVAAQYEIKAGLKCESCKEWKYGAGNRQNSPTLLVIKLLMHLINSAICGTSLSDKWARSNPTPDYGGTAEL